MCYNNTFWKLQAISKVTLRCYSSKNEITSLPGYHETNVTKSSGVELIALGKRQNKSHKTCKENNLILNKADDAIAYKI